MTSKEIRSSVDYRIAMAKHLRKNPRCFICGSIKGRIIHHKNCVKYFPELATNEDNLVTLCDYRSNDCHGRLHYTFKRSSKQKTTEDDFNRMVELMIHGRDIMK